MSDEPSREALLRFLERVQLQQLDQTRRWIRQEQQRQAELAGPRHRLRTGSSSAASVLAARLSLSTSDTASWLARAPALSRASRRFSS